MNGVAKTPPPRMKTIQKTNPLHATVTAPPSKSYSVRALLLAAITVTFSRTTARLSRKPSATPAASAIWRVLTSRPNCSSSGSVAAMRAARRSSGGIGVARDMRTIVLSEYSLSKRNTG